MPAFEIWTAYSDRRPHDDLTAPDRVVEARDEADAATQAAASAADDHCAFYVRRVGGDQLLEIELHKEWEVDWFSPVAIDAAFKPAEDA